MFQKHFKDLMLNDKKFYRLLTIFLTVKMDTKIKETVCKIHFQIV